VVGAESGGGGTSFHWPEFAECTDLQPEECPTVALLFPGKKVGRIPPFSSHGGLTPGIVNIMLLWG